MKNIVLAFTLFLLSVINTNSNEVDLSDAYFQFGWKNLENPTSSLIDIPNANATLEILKSEIYLDKKESIKKRNDYLSGSEIDINEIDEDLIVEDLEGYYVVKVTYNNSGYVKTNDFDNFTSQDLLQTLNRTKREDISKFTWVSEPQISNNKIGFMGYRVDWNDGSVSYDFEGIVLGRYGYISLYGYFNGDGEESDELLEFWKNTILDISNTVKFKEGYAYSDYVVDDTVAVFNFTNILDGSFGMTGATNQTIFEVNCLVSKADLEKALLAKEDHARFLGKEIKFYISEVNNNILDISDHDELNVITGMYGINDSQKFEKIKQRAKGNYHIVYTNTIEVTGDTEEEKIKYDYKNKLVFEKGKPKLLFANVDQTGFSMNKWKFVIDCRDYPYTEEEKKIALGSSSLNKKSSSNTLGKPEWFDELVDKVITEGK